MYLQGESKLKFLCHIIKQVDSSVPSIAQLKALDFTRLSRPQKVQYMVCASCVEELTVALHPLYLVLLLY